MFSLVKKYLKKPTTVVLTLGASLLLGLLSFGGMYVLWPWLSLSIAAMFLSVIYEGEIYHKNITNALNKLLDKNFTAEILGEEFLNNFDFTKTNLPNFFKTYKKLAQRNPSPAQEKRLKIMHIWLGQLLIQRESESSYAKKVIEYLNKNTELEKLKTKAQEIKSYNQYIQIFSLVAASFMSLGTIFLILEVLPALPFLSISPAVLPYIVLPLAGISGIAYGFLTYNSLTDFLLKNNLKKWWQDIKAQLSTHDNSWKKMSFAIFSAFIFTLNLALTLCTAGTWWTVVSSSNTTWAWLKHPLTKGVSNLIAPVVSISTLGFNLENTLETISEVQEALQSPESQHQPLKTKSQETYAQIFNPFRILLKITYTPILIILFLGHLIGIGLTADRMPGVPALVSTLLGMLSEGFEDFHYFFDLKKFLKPLAIFFKIIASPFVAIGYLFQAAQEKPALQEIRNKLGNIFTEGFQQAFESENAHENCAHAHHHEHSDIPSQVVQIIFTPLFALSALWHYSFQDKLAKSPKSYQECFYLQLGWDNDSQNNDFNQVQSITETSWLKAEAQFQLAEHMSYLKEQTINPELATQKQQELKKIYDKLNSASTQLKDIIPLTNGQDVSFNKHRFFTTSHKTATQEFIDELVKNLTPAKAQNCCGTFNILDPKGKFGTSN